MNITKTDVEKALQLALPGWGAHQTMIPPNREILHTQQKVKKSAVLILIIEKNTQLYVCLTKRNSNMKHHAGQISFPGGKCEKTDPDTAYTAKRETFEEIGILPQHITIIGKLSEVFVPVSNFTIQPFVAFASKNAVFDINTAEVDKLIFIELNEFLNEKNISSRSVKTHKGTLDTPCYFINNEIIWGATSMMIAELAAILKQYYSHRV
jgi:8-oxo-dGTP pyrophosphatase MutT (NUDIX family)